MKRLLLPALLLTALNTDAQTKKVLLEDFTGTWCQYCPNGTKGIETLLGMYPTNFIPVSSHNANGDPLEVAETPQIIAGLGGASYPNGAVDRKFFTGTKVPVGIDASASNWKTMVQQQTGVAAIASVGFSIGTIKADTYKVKVHIKFTSAPKAGIPLAVQVMILEDSIKAEGTLQQSNSDINGNIATTHYGSDKKLTTTKNNYWHNHNVRQYLGGAWGFTDVFPASGPVVGTEYVKEIAFTIPSTGTIPGPNGWNKKQVHLVAFVAYNGSKHLEDEKMVLNAEETSLKNFWKVGVENENTNNISILNAAPNPAGINDLVKFQYNISNSEVVTMKVYNMVGQLIAQPYISNEVKGIHTIDWRPSESNVTTPGIYLIEVSSPSGKQVQRINIR